MATRQAHTRWEGNLKNGAGTVDFGHGMFKGPIRLPRASRTAAARIRKSCWARLRRAASPWRCR